MNISTSPNQLVSGAELARAADRPNEVVADAIRAKIIEPDFWLGSRRRINLFRPTRIAGLVAILSAHNHGGPKA